MKFWEHIGLIGDLSQCEDVYRALNHNFFLSDTMMQLAVIDFVDEIPENPNEQDAYILSDDVDPYKKDDLIMWDGKKWLQLDPKFGYVASVESILKPYWYNGTEWTELPSGPADVSGPGSSRDKSIARWDGTTGKLLNDSSVYVDDDGNVTDVKGLYSEKVNTNVVEGGNFIVEEISPKNILLGGLFNTILDPIVEIDSIDLTPDIEQSSFFFIENKSESDILVKENTSILTGLEDDFVFKNKSSIVIYYSELTDTFNIISGGGSGGTLIVDDIAARNAIPALSRKVGMTVTVLDDGNGNQKDYWLVGGITNSDWEEKKSGGGILTVATKVALDAVPAEDKYDGLFAFQLNDRILWEWDARYTPRWVMFAGSSVTNVSDASSLNLGVRAIDNYIYINATDDLVSPQEPFQSGIYNQLNAKVTVINNSDYAICLRGGGSTWRIEGDDVWLSAKGHSATFLKASDSWILIGRSN